MLLVIAARDRYLGANIHEMATAAKIQSIRTLKLDRIKKELKI